MLKIGARKKIWNFTRLFSLGVGGAITKAIKVNLFRKSLMLLLSNNAFTFLFFLKI